MVEQKSTIWFKTIAEFRQSIYRCRIEADVYLDGGGRKAIGVVAEQLAKRNKVITSSAFSGVGREGKKKR